MSDVGFTCAVLNVQNDEMNTWKPSLHNTTSIAGVYVCHEVMAQEGIQYQGPFLAITTRHLLHISHININERPPRMRLRWHWPSQMTTASPCCGDVVSSCNPAFTQVASRLHFHYSKIFITFWVTGPVFTVTNVLGGWSSYLWGDPSFLTFVSPLTLSSADCDTLFHDLLHQPFCASECFISNRQKRNYSVGDCCSLCLATQHIPPEELVSSEVKHLALNRLSIRYQFFFGKA